NTIEDVKILKYLVDNLDKELEVVKEDRVVGYLNKNQDRKIEEFLKSNSYKFAENLTQLD
ncbi:92_t:CDS:1, partial [Racocetra persica]